MQRLMFKPIHALLPSVALVFACLAAGAQAQPEDAKAAPKPLFELPEKVEKRLATIEKQIGELDQAASGLRKELEKLEASRNELRINAANLRAELTGAEPHKAGEAIKKSVNTAKPVEQAPAGRPHVSFTRFAIRFVLILLIVVAVFTIGRIFISRWHEAEPEPMVEKQTGLGTVRHPASMEIVPDKIEPVAAQKEPSAAAADDDKSIEFKNPAPGQSDAAPGDKTSSKDYY